MKRRLKFILGLFVYAATIGLVLTVLAVWWVYSEFKKPGPLETPTLYTLERGTTANGSAYQLYDENIIHDPFIFMIGVTVMGDHTALRAGEYEIPAKASAHDIVNILTEGKTYQRQVTVREGLTSYEIVELLKTVQDLKQEEISVPAEGILLPDTYSYHRDESTKTIFHRLEEDMITVLMTKCQIEAQIQGALDLMDIKCGAPPLKTVKDVLILASIVEKETGVPEERRRVAGVFINRLNRGIALQTDPTVIYALTDGKPKNEGKGPLGRRLLKKDLDFDSPYNTYKYPGLPPGPIANPGRASIEAVLNPEEHDYIYFVADGTGGHVFAKTLEEHNQNVAKWRKIRRKQETIN